MGISISTAYFDAAQAAQQHTLRSAVINVTGLTGSNKNTIPHELPSTPLAVIVNAWDPNGSAVLEVGLDGSVTDAENGWDDTNVYVVAGSSAVSCQLVVFF